MAMQHSLATIKKLWTVWEIRILILLSLLLQIILIIFGSRRKYTKGIWIRIIVWSAFVAADSVATVSLGILSRSQGNLEDKDFSLHVFWAPFLLMHLGGPDTITAYSLEDNELWLRHFLGFVVQVGLAFYVYFQSLSNTALTFLAIPMFITGIIKYGERTWVLRSSSATKLKESLLSPPDPGPSIDKRSFLGIVTEEENPEEHVIGTAVTIVPNEGIHPEGDDLKEAYFLFKRFTYLFADLILGYYERKDSYSIIHNKSAEDAFKLVSIELGFMYDTLYTKATMVYSRLGVFVRCINFFSLTSALVVFSTIIDMHAYSIADISITCLLLVLAVVLEVYSLFLLCFSDWTRLWLRKFEITWPNSTFCTTCSSHFLPNNGKKWSESMAQYNLIDVWTEGMDSISCIGVCISESLEKNLNLTWEDVNVDLQQLIFSQLLEKGNQIKDDSFSIELCKELLAHRGDYVLKEKYHLDDEFSWSISTLEFDHSLLLWHIATHLCYTDDFPECKISKCLANYMLYLLVICPQMLPKGIGEMRYRDTCAEAMNFLEIKRLTDNDNITLINKRSWACKKLLEVDVNIPSEEIKGNRSQSVLFYACKLAKQLNLLDSRDGWSPQKKWDMINEVWVEMLTYAASHCEWKEHGQQLRKGGELLTHVRLLMVHLGLSEQYQIQRKYIIHPEPIIVDLWLKLIRKCLKQPCCMVLCCCISVICYFPCEICKEKLKKADVSNS